MYEYYIRRRTSGEESVIYGYTLMDAIEKHHLLEAFNDGDVIVIDEEYID